MIVVISLSRVNVRTLAVIVIFIFVCDACSPRHPPLVSYWPSWKYTDLRLLDPVDSEDPDVDLIGLYTRRSGKEVQVRLDLLDLQEDIEFELVLAFDTMPGTNFSPIGQDVASRNTHYIMIRSDFTDNLQVSTIDHDLRIERLRLVRDPENDTIVISFFSNSPTRIINATTSVTAWVNTKTFGGPVDITGPVKISAAPPKQADVMLYFWNTFAAATPAQALRRWDGAHSGPESARHGLKHLLDAVENTNIPVILTDLKKPEILSALDYMDKLSRIRHMANANLIFMPDVSSINLTDHPALSLPGWIYEKELWWAHQVALDFKIRETQAFAAYQWPESLPVPVQYHLALPSQVLPYSTASLCGQGHVRVLCNIKINSGPLLEGTNSQVNEHGLAIEARKQILEAAFSDDNSIMFLGGDLGLSTWGIQAAPMKAMSYLRNHPWIRVLTFNDLQTWETSSGIETPGKPVVVSPFVPVSGTGEPIKSGKNTQEINFEVLSELAKLPESDLAQPAWEWYFELLSSRSDPHHRLNAATLNQVGHLLAGARWLAEPYNLATCTVDLDWDGKDECILASSDFFASFELQGGALVTGFLRTTDGVQQVVAPTYQVYSGTSDPFLWKTDQGYLGDPDAVSGAFIESSSGESCCTLQSVGEDNLEFVSEDMAMRKKYVLESSSLQVVYQTRNTVIVSGMLVNNPWDRFHPGWADIYPLSNVSGDGSGLQLGNIRLYTNVEQSSGLFTTSKEYLGEPEDPNFDYTSGHNLLFPYGSFTITGNGEFWIRLDWSK